MSVTNPVNTNNQSTWLYDRTKVFLGCNTFEEHAYKAPAAEVTLTNGQVMGRVSATGALLELKSGAADGSEIPFGILVGDHTIAIGETPNLSVCVSGNVSLNDIVFDGADTVATVVDGRRLDDRIAGDTLGVKLISGTENTIDDNV